MWFSSFIMGSQITIKVVSLKEREKNIEFSGVLPAATLRTIEQVDALNTRIRKHFFHCKIRTSAEYTDPILVFSFSSDLGLMMIISKQKTESGRSVFSTYFQCSLELLELEFCFFFLFFSCIARCVGCASLLLFK